MQLRCHCTIALTERRSVDELYPAGGEVDVYRILIEMTSLNNPGRPPELRNSSQLTSYFHFWGTAGAAKEIRACKRVRRKRNQWTRQEICLSSAPDRAVLIPFQSSYRSLWAAGSAARPRYPTS